MLLLGENVLGKAGQKHVGLTIVLDTWANRVKSATWNSLQDVRKDYPNADGVKLQSKTVVTVFNIKGNDYRILTAIVYAVQSVRVLEVLTHAEYSKNRWKDGY